MPMRNERLIGQSTRSNLCPRSTVVYHTGIISEIQKLRRVLLEQLSDGSQITCQVRDIKHISQQ